MESKMKFTVGQNKYYVWFDDDLKDRVVYTDEFGSHFYKKDGKIIYFSNKEEDDFRELRKKYN